MKNRKELLNQMADKIEQDIRKAIEAGPNKCYTLLDSFCYVCLECKPRQEVKLVVEDPNNILDDKLICNTCIDKHKIKVTDSPRTLEFEATTIAIQRIRKSAKIIEMGLDQ